ncbi:polysaccharide biosynthesis/export family protein [Acinetobacter sp. S40]|uniref:polysaccharide biosynthesis/export family protein n=1 Tax=unclassified Acinetobacter TaxID=196816 RepID=UPI00190C26CA|nr:MULTISPECIES: polysaccharide biosynthesis/export family protein [unclassified Acinetobacter]MBJ9986109.1 polysaccharide biosynthesis/export family protein [Acinetobacter sp. S40]MBK0064281.1 polysaccharide biosynthesis/export family protein [Acinetobacter sp. S55]MBK0067727.1 polysaccharide biosynthesis/export family protein [Acinetobacter sp. S54]
MKHYQNILILALCINGTGCAVTSGFQTYDVPEEGSFQTDLGTSVDVIKITANNLPIIQSTANALPAGSLTSLFKRHSSIYTLSAGDVLSIQLWNYPEIAPPTTSISNDQSVQAYGYPIDQEGYIQFPLVGRYKASGKTLAQINRELRNRLGQYLKNPDVVVRVLSYEGKRYSVQGSVTKGGQFFLSDQPVSVYTALGLAGGVTDKGDDTSIQLIRNGTTYDLNSIALEKQGYSLHKLLIQPNDTLYVNSRENQKIYVMGEAGKNQALEMRNQGMNLSDVLGESLGINPTSASASRIYVLRSNIKTHQTQLYHLNLLSLGDFGLANQFQMKKNDIVYIDATGLTRWQRIVNQIIPFSNLIYTTDRLGQ